jgi:hypothetical protein
MEEDEIMFSDLNDLIEQPETQDELNIVIEGDGKTEEEDQDPPKSEEKGKEDQDKDLETEPQPKTSADVKSILKNVLGGTYKITVPNEDGEDVDKNIDELELTTEEASNLLLDFLENEKQLALSNKVSTEGLSDVVKTIMTIDKAGGDITSVLKVQEQYIDPLSKIDLATTEGQKDVLRLAYRAENKLGEDEIEVLIQGFEAKGILEEKATTVEGSLRNQVKAFQEAQIKKAEEELEKRKANIKIYKNAAKEHLSTIKVKESILAEAVKTLVTETEKGRYKIDDEFEKALKDPKRAAELAVFLLSKSEYDTVISQHKVIEEKLKDSKKLSLRRETNKEKTQEPKTTSTGEIDFSAL